MKKALGILSLFPLMLVLTSCEVHWFGESWQVPWYVIAIPVAVIILFGFILALRSIIHHTYKCPKCGEEFQPKWYEFSAFLRDGDDRVMRCPKCGRKGFCKKKDQ